MSGSIADYGYFRINDVIDDIERIIENNNTPDEYGYKYDYKEDTIEEFQEAIKFLTIARVYAHRIDWLVSGDDSEESFHSRLFEELQEFV